MQRKKNGMRKNEGSGFIVFGYAWFMNGLVCPGLASFALYCLRACSAFFRLLAHFILYLLLKTKITETRSLIRGRGRYI